MMNQMMRGLVCTVQALVLTAGLAFATASDAQTEQTARKDLVLRGDARCTRCHAEDEEHPVLSIAQTRHGVVADGRTPTCESCHGQSETHVTRPAGAKVRPPPDVVFSKGTANTVAALNQPCLACHESDMRINWKGSQHEAADVACTSCHALHLPKDKVLVRSAQQDVCFACHKEQRAQIMRPSHHPLRQGEMSCSQCHNPHGSPGPAMLVKPTLNETCYTCHAEKRGPFLWEHPPAREDCSSCHTPHGSIHTPLLKARGPWLCQQCHLASMHPSTAYSGTGVPPRGAAQQVLVNNCANCHSQVHGTNHPSGPRKTR
jgi:DmsE family decaheme c-type cytochrome